MALRLPGKGNFKPVKPTIRRPPVPQPSSSAPAKAARPDLPRVAEPAPSTAPLPAPAPSSPVKAAPLSPQRPKTIPASQASPVKSAVSKASVPPIAIPAVRPQPKVIEEGRRDREDSVVSEYTQPPTPSGSTPTTPRGPRKAKPLLAAAAASKTPTQRGTLKERERIKQIERAEREKHAAETQASARFTPTPRHSPAPTDSGWIPPTVVATSSQPVASPLAQTQTPSEWPPTVGDNGFPPSVAFQTQVSNGLSVHPAVATAGGDSEASTPDPAALAAALVASIEQPAPAPATSASRKRQVRKKASPDPDVAPSAPKRQRTARTQRQETVDSDDGVSDPGDGEYEEEAEPKARVARGKYSRSGRAGTAQDRRTNAFKRQAAIAQPDLQGIEENGMVGVEVNSATMRMSDLATTMVAQGRVSARTIKLANFQRSEEERKLRERAIRTEKNWRRRQIVRRKARELRNNQRADRREAAQSEGLNPDDVVSADEIDSDEDFDVEPDRLTPPGSPRQQERVAPVSFEPQQEGAEEAEPDPAADGEDIEGLGITQGEGMEDDEDIGEELGENFQLPVEDDGAEDAGPDFAGLEFNEGYSGGYLDDEGNWVEGGTGAQAAILQQRNEDHRRRLLDGTHGQQVEVIDNETQFINSATWGKKVNNDRWTSEETELFFAVLRETGENYTLMKAYFPGRSVRQLKNKGSRENRVNPQRMTDAILNRKPMDKEYLAKSSGFNVEKPYDRENAFLDEVAREKDRIVAGLLPEGMEAPVDGEWGDMDPLEFVQGATA